MPSACSYATDPTVLTVGSRFAIRPGTLFYDRGEIQQDQGSECDLATLILYTF